MKFYSDILAKAGLIVDGTTQLNTIANASIDTDKFIVSDSGVIKYRTGTQLASDIDAMTKTVYDSDNDGTVDDSEKITVTARNSTGSTIYKGTIVYFSGSTGNRPNMLKAQAHTEATSSKTFGVVVDDVADNSDGQVAAMGTLHDLDTRSSAPNPFTSDTLVDGDVLWLSPTTAGYVTRTKPTSPNHAVFIGYVARTSPTNGRIVYKIQNGLELDELHNVSASTPSNNDGIFYNSTTGLWEAKAITAISGITGSGTTNYLPKWTSASALGNSLVYDNGTNVGIGTTSPAYKLDVNGVIKSATGLYVGPVNYAAASINVSSFTTKSNFANSVMTLSSTETGSGGIYPTQVVFAQEGATVGWSIQSVNQGVSYTPLILNHNGSNVLIGTTTNSGYKLDVNGDLRLQTIANATTDTDRFIVSDSGVIKYRTGSQILSDIGAQPLLTNPVTGSGTTNYIAKFTGSTAIGNSKLTDSSNILDYLASGGNAAFRVISPSGSYYPSITWLSNGTSATVITGYLTNSYYEATGGIRLNGNGTGNVMVGTNTDGGQKLQVVGGTTLLKGSGNDVNTTTFRAESANGTSAVMSFRNDGSLTINGLEFKGQTGQVIHSNIDVYFTGYQGLENIRLSFYAGVIINEGGRSDVDLRVEGDTDVNLLFTDASADKVGIGNNAPTYKLDVTGDIRTTTSAYFATTSGAVGVNTTSVNSSALFQVDSTTKGILPPRMTSAQRAAISTPAVGLLVYQTDGTEGTYEYASTGWRIINAASSGGVTDGDKGDITVSGSGATWTIDNTAVTYAKIQNVADNRILGRSAGSAGTVQEITIGTGLSLSSGTLTATGTSYSVASVSTTHTETATSGTKVLKADTTGGTFTITLPTAVGNTATIIVKKVAGSATLTIDGSGSETIDGGTTASIVEVYESVTLISDNSNWQII